jgi:hypothetical protein
MTPMPPETTPKAKHPIYTHNYDLPSVATGFLYGVVFSILFNRFIDFLASR